MGVRERRAPHDPGPDLPHVEGPLLEALRFSDEALNIWFSASPGWAVATDIDLPSTYVGGSRGLVDALLGDARFEALEVDASNLVSMHADTLNT